MITFDLLTLKAFISEEKNFFCGARIGKIQQPTRRELILNLRNAGITRQFYINIDPVFYHVCFMNSETYSQRNIKIPQKPPMFCMLLRKYLENSKIAKVEMPENERILELYVETYNEIGDSVYLCLAVELMGRYSNIILYNYDTNIIIGCAHNVGAEKSRDRELAGTLPYIYPPKQNKMNILEYNGEVDYSKLSSEFYMFSGNFAALCSGKSLEKLKSYVKLENLSPCISKNYQNYCLYSELLPDNFRCTNVNEMIDMYYSHQICCTKFRAVKSHYKTIVRQKLKKINKVIAQLEERKNNLADSDKYRLFGDLLMANLYCLHDFSSEVSLYDYENDRQISITLDGTKSIKDNANKFYKMYAKAKVSLSKISELKDSYLSQKLYFDQLLYSVDIAQNIDDLMEISNEVEPDKPSVKVNKVSDIMKIELDDGTRIYIGKNNKQNDYIVSKLASEDDLWFHVHNNAGSHVLLKSQKPSDALILRCAQLAKEYSAGKNSSKIGVIYTKRRYLRKPPGAALGYVTYKNEKEIIID